MNLMLFFVQFYFVSSQERWESSFVGKDCGWTLGFGIIDPDNVTLSEFREASEEYGFPLLPYYNIIYTVNIHKSLTVPVDFNINWLGLIGKFFSDARHISKLTNGLTSKLVFASNIGYPSQPILTKRNKIRGLAIKRRSLFPSTRVLRFELTDFQGVPSLYANQFDIKFRESRDANNVLIADFEIDLMFSNRIDFMLEGINPNKYSEPFGLKIHFVRSQLPLTGFDTWSCPKNQEYYAPAVLGSTIFFPIKDNYQNSKVKTVPYSGSVQLQVTVTKFFAPFGMGRVFFKGKCALSRKQINPFHIQRSKFEMYNGGQEFAYVVMPCWSGNRIFKTVASIKSPMGDVVCCLSGDVDCKIPKVPLFKRNIVESSNDFCLGKVTYNQAEDICRFEPQFEEGSLIIAMNKLENQPCSFVDQYSDCYPHTSGIWVRGKFTLYDNITLLQPFPSETIDPPEQRSALADVEFEFDSDIDVQTREGGFDDYSFFWISLNEYGISDTINIDVRYGSFDPKVECDFLELLFEYESSTGESAEEKVTIRVSNHQGYFFNLYINLQMNPWADIVSWRQFLHLTPNFQGIGENRVFDYTIKDAWKTPGKLPDFGIDFSSQKRVSLEASSDYVVRFRTFYRGVDDSCMFFTSNVRTSFEMANFVVYNNVEIDAFSTNLETIISGTYYPIHIVYKYVAGQDVTIILKFLCDSFPDSLTSIMDLGITVPSWNLFTREPLVSPFSVSLEPLASDQTGELSPLWGTIDLDPSGMGYVDFRLAVLPKNSVFVKCFSEDPAIIIDQCEFIFKPEHWLEMYRLTVYDAGSKTNIDSKIVCNVESEDPVFQGTVVEIPCRSTIDAITFECSSTFDGRIFEPDGGLTRCGGGSSRSYTLIETKESPFTFIVQAHAQICDGNGGICNTAVMVQYGDEIFGVYRPRNENAVRPMCINSDSTLNSNIFIHKEHNDYVISTLSGIVIEINIVYGDSNNQFLDIHLNLPRFLIPFLTEGICAGDDQEKYNAKNRELEKFPEVKLVEKFSKVPVQCKDIVQSDLTDSVRDTALIGPFILKNYSVLTEDAQLEDNVCEELGAKLGIVKSFCVGALKGSDMKLQSMCQQRKSQCDAEAIIQSTFSTLWHLLKNSAPLPDFCQKLIDNNPELCSGAGYIRTDGCKCDPGTYGPSCSARALDDAQNAHQNVSLLCKDRSLLLDCRTGQAWKCYKGLCMYSKNGLNWEGLPSTPYCLTAVSWDDFEKRTGRTLWGFTNTYNETCSVDDGQTWEECSSSLDEKSSSSYSLVLDPVNKSPGMKGNLHHAPNVTSCGNQKWWLTEEEVCVSSSVMTIVDKPVIFCSKWWCDCVDEEVWGRTFGIQQSSEDQDLPLRPQFGKWW